jgi:RNA polymerase sigma factor (sigma-70 family)
MSKKVQSVHENEDVIMRAFRAGDKDAFCQIHDQMVRQLTYFVENIIFSHVDAEDIVANAFYKLFKAREGLKSFDHVKRWLYVIVRNEAIDYLRSRSRLREASNEVAYLASDIEEKAETERVKTILLQSILTEIEKLPPQRKAILKMYFLEQKTTAEIADSMGLNSQTVLNHKAKALESLRNSGFKAKWLREGIPAFLLAITLFLLK